MGNVHVICLHTSKNIGFNVLLCKDGQRSIHIIKQLKTEMRKYKNKKGLILNNMRC